MTTKVTNINRLIANVDIQAFLSQYNSNYNPNLIRDIRLKYGDAADILIDQSVLYPKAEKKLPSFCAAGCLFTRQGLEQCSSEVTAQYKAQLFSGNGVLSLCGGLGVDDVGFSHSFKKVISVDNDSFLNDLARYNFDKLDAANITRIDSSAEEFLRTNKDSYDLVYIDADRRPGKGPRQFLIENSEPYIPGILPNLFEISERILLKLSPMLDLQAIFHSLPGCVHTWVVSYRNEVKEILVELHKNAEVKEVQIHAIDLKEKGNLTSFSSSGNNEQPVYGDDGLFFYEPGLSLIKSGLSGAYLAQIEAKQIAPQVVYGVSDKEIVSFFGRAFRIISSLPFTRRQALNYLRISGIKRGNIAERNFPSSAIELRRMLQLADGGPDYFFFFTNWSAEKTMIHCRKVSQIKVNT